MRANVAVTFLAVASSAAFGQSPKFEIADVHMSAPATNPYTFASGGELRGERYDLRKATMLDLIRIAYGVDPERVLGGPNWLELDRFDVSAKAPLNTPPETLDLMLRELLAERFSLVAHKDMRPMPAFALTAGKGKPKLREAATGGQSGCRSAPQPGPYSTMACRNMTMDAFTETLRGFAGDYLVYPVLNTTGLQSTWDFDLRWNPRSQVLPGGAGRTTIFDALEQQLGLTLELTKTPEQVLVVDRVNEKPSPNPPGVAQQLPPRITEFEVATLRPSRPDETGSWHVYPNGRIEVRGIPMRSLMGAAWDFDEGHSDEAVIGAPGWIGSRRFDIVAETAPATNPPLRTALIDDDVRLMLQRLLVDRFHIAWHYENRPTAAYTLIAVKPKLKKANPANRSNCRQAGVVADDPQDKNPRLSQLIVCQNMTMAQFATRLQGVSPYDFARPVQDGTRMQGAYDFSLSYTPSYLIASGEPDGSLSIFDAVGELGLKLEMRKRSLPVIVIDHMEDQPVGN